jgi:hypothetical protein
MIRSRSSSVIGRPLDIVRILILLSQRKISFYTNVAVRG